MSYYYEHLPSLDVKMPKEENLIIYIKQICDGENKFILPFDNLIWKSCCYTLTEELRIKYTVFLEGMKEIDEEDYQEQIRELIFSWRMT